MSAYEKTGNWKSPRKVEEEIRDYKRTRFEWYMQRADNGELPRELAITALREELGNIVELEDCKTQPIDTSELRSMLDYGAA